jgi:hypothetical protein
MQNKPKNWKETYEFYLEIIEAQKAIKKVSELDESDVEAKMFSNLRSKNA